MSDFDERSGSVQCSTPWGCWWQTNEEVFIEISVAQGTAAKDINCTFGTKSAHVTVKGLDVIKVSYFQCVSS